MFSNYTGPVGEAGGMTFRDGDTDMDGDIDDADLGNGFSNYTGPMSSASVPEPSTAAGLSAALLAMRRRRR
jgi:hypothetical protein